MNSFVRKNIATRQKYEAIRNLNHSRKRGGKVDKKKVTKVTQGDDRSQKNVMPTTQKKPKILRVMFVSLNDPYDADLFCCIFYECIC